MLTRVRARASVRLSICPSVHLSFCPSVHLSICPSVHLSICPSVRLSIICRSVHLSIDPSIFASIRSSSQLRTGGRARAPARLHAQEPASLHACIPTHPHSHIPLRTSQIKHILKLPARKRLGTRWARYPLSRRQAFSPLHTRTGAWWPSRGPKWTASRPH